MIKITVKIIPIQNDLLEPAGEALVGIRRTKITLLNHLKENTHLESLSVL